MNEKSEKAIAAHLFAQREEGFVHTSFDREIAFYDSICSGNIELVRMLCTPLCSEGYGILSNDAVRNMKYHFAISAALIARFCIKSGMPPGEAYHLSDCYIMKADQSRTQDEIHAVHAEMLEVYTRQMRFVRNSKIYSKQIIKTIDYISDHLHSRIMLQDAAEHLQINAAYLSRLFKSEMGVPFVDYVNRKKVESAANLLLFSEYSDLDISNLLCFSSQSYFIKIFKKYTGVTPKSYRKYYQMPDLRQNA